MYYVVLNSGMIGICTPLHTLSVTDRITLQSLCERYYR